MPKLRRKVQAVAGKFFTATMTGKRPSPEFSRILEQAKLSVLHAVGLGVLTVGVTFCSMAGVWSAPANANFGMPVGQAVDRVLPTADLTTRQLGEDGGWMEDEGSGGDDWLGEDSDWDDEWWEDDLDWDELEETAPPAPKLTVRAPKSQAIRRGRRASLKIQITNVGDAPATEGTLTLRLPKGVKLSKAVGVKERWSSNGGKVRLLLATLREDRSKTVTLKLQVTRRAQRRTVSVPLTMQAHEAETVRATVKLRIR